MADKYSGMGIGIFELDSECACFVALDAAAKAADIQIQGVERNRINAGACVKMRGRISDLHAAMDAALAAAEPISEVFSHTIIASPTDDTGIAMAMTINK